jgi:hypothetical protein
MKRKERKERKDGIEMFFLCGLCAFALKSF